MGHPRKSVYIATKSAVNGKIWSKTIENSIIINIYLVRDHFTRGKNSQTVAKILKRCEAFAD